MFDVHKGSIYTFLPELPYRISSNKGRALNTSRASNTGRGSDVIVLTEAGGFYSRKYGSFFKLATLKIHNWKELPKMILMA